MADEDSKKEYDESEEQDEEKDTEDEKDDSVEKSLNALVETIKSFDITGLRDDLGYVAEKMDSFEERLKALEDPTDLKIKPKTSDSEDIGTEVTAPEDYQSNSVQAGIKEADPHGSEDDDSGLKMQKKSNQNYAFTTETPRPNSGLETVEKSAGIQLNDVLKASREVGYEGLSSVGRRILKGDFGSPYEGESQW